MQMHFSMHFSSAPKVVMVATRADNIQANISKTQAAIPGAQVDCKNKAAPGQPSSAYLQGSRFCTTNIETEFK